MKPVLKVKPQYWMVGTSRCDVTAPRFRALICGAEQTARDAAILRKTHNPSEACHITPSWRRSGGADGAARRPYPARLPKTDALLRKIRPSTAFTLIEVMLAVAIAAIVLVAINTVFFAALRMRTRTTEATERTLPVESAVAAIKRDLLGTVPPGAMAGVMSSDTTTVGISQPVSLEFYTAAGIVADEVPWGDVQKVDYWLQAPTNQAASASGGKDLVRGVTRNLLATTQETPEQQVLIDNVQNLRFSYFDGTNWNDTWSSTLSNIPTAIKVFINFSSKSGGSTNIPVQFVVPIITQASTNKIQAVN